MQCTRFVLGATLLAAWGLFSAACSSEVDRSPTPSYEPEEAADAEASVVEEPPEEIIEDPVVENSSDPAQGSGSKEPEQSAAPGTPATVRGSVKLKGTPPPRLPLAIAGKAGCDHGQDTPLTESVISVDGKLANVFVYIRKGLKADQKGPVPTEPVRLTQHGCVYQPHVSGARAGQKILVSNEDPTAHNVHTYSKRADDINRTQGAGGPDVELVYEDSEVAIAVGCDIHPWMKAYLCIVDHPFWAVTGEDGSFEIEGIPAGKYTLTAWHEKYKRVDVKLNLAPGGSAEATFEFRAK